VKNQFYLVILIVSLAVCGVVMFRPQMADRVLGLLGLQDRDVSQYDVAEWDGLTADATSENDALVFDSTALSNDSDGFAVASPMQTALPTQSQSPVFDLPNFEPFGQYNNNNANGFNTNVPIAFDEGVAVSGASGGRMPDFFFFFDAPLGTPSAGFE
jgi:hypothetical protein